MRKIYTCIIALFRLFIYARCFIRTMARKRSNDKAWGLWEKEVERNKLASWALCIRCLKRQQKLQRCKCRRDVDNRNVNGRLEKLQRETEKNAGIFHKREYYCAGYETRCNARLSTFQLTSHVFFRDGCVSWFSSSRVTPGFNYT